MRVDEDRLRHAVVRIFDRGRRVVGTGFFVTRDLVATCAHVVNQAPQEDGGVEIQLLEGIPEGVTLRTTLERESFRDEDVEDVAFLRLKPLPPWEGACTPYPPFEAYLDREARKMGVSFEEIRAYRRAVRTRSRPHRGR